MSEATPLLLHEFHQNLGAHFITVSGAEVVADYGDTVAEHTALRETAGVLDLSFRSRVCLTGADRVRFLHGQVTNDVKRLRVGKGCYAALVTAKGKMESDFNIYCLQDELLLDFEPGLTQPVLQRMEKYIVADDVHVVDVAPHYGLVSVQGPKAAEVVRGLGLFTEMPNAPLDFVKVADATFGEIYLMSHPRISPPLPGSERGRGQGEGALVGSGDQGAMLGSGNSLPARNEPSSPQPSPPSEGGGGASVFCAGFDIFVPSVALAGFANRLIAAAKSIAGRACGWAAFEMARLEAGIPRFGPDMDETNIPLECGIAERAISFTKGCYIGQEVINRIHSIGHVNRELRGLRLDGHLKTLPVKGDKLFKAGKEVGYITSAVASPTLKANLALGYVRREVSAVGTELALRMVPGEIIARIAELPFAK